jgi:hypothetical protein
MHRTNYNRNNARVAAFLISIVTGISIWALSNSFTGYSEPWDSPSVYYSVSIALFSFVLGLIFPRHSIFITTGMIFGQFGYMMSLLPNGPLWPVGLLTLIVYTAILGLPISWLGTKLRMLILP